jgi:hypothetical protein
MNDHLYPDRDHAAERYLLGEMSDADRERYEEHVFGCPECAEDVRTTATFLDDLRAYVAPPGATRSQSAQVVSLERGVPARRLRSLFWPLPAGAAVAATLMIAVIGYQAFTVGGLRRSLTQEQEIQSVSSHFLAVARSEGTTITVSNRDRKIDLRFNRLFDREFPFYRCEIRNAAGQRVASKVLDAPASGDELEILVPTDRLAEGLYTVVIAGLESAGSTTSPLEPANYQFTLQRQR